MASPAINNAQDSSASSHTAGSRDNESGVEKPKHGFYALPRWPRYIGIALHIIVISSSIIIIALVCHSLKSYSGTRDIKFSGILTSWPKDLNLRPAYFFLTSSSLSLALSVVLSVYSFLRRNRPSFTAVEVASTIIGVIMSALWITADVLQHQSEKTPKKDVLMWSCRRRGSPTNSLVSYASICNEQVGPPLPFFAPILTFYRKLSRTLQS